METIDYPLAFELIKQNLSAMANKMNDSKSDSISSAKNWIYEYTLFTHVADKLVSTPVYRFGLRYV